MYSPSLLVAREVVQENGKLCPEEGRERSVFWLELKSQRKYNDTDTIAAPPR
jgi:hypothetical protein